MTDKNATIYTELEGAADAACSARWFNLGDDVWIIRQNLAAGTVKKHQDGWAAVLWTPNGHWSMGMEGMSQRTVYRKTLDAAKTVLERHWQNAPARQPTGPTSVR